MTERIPQPAGLVAADGYPMTPPLGGAVQAVAQAPKAIATLPPIPENKSGIELSERTGEPKRVASVVAAVLLGNVASIPILAMYAVSWWRAVYLDTFPDSAYLIRLVVDSGQQLSSGWGLVLGVVLLAVLAGLTALAIAAPCVVAYNAWNGQSWTRGGSIVSTLIVAFIVFWFSGPADPFTSWLTLGWGWLGVLFAGLSAVLLWLPGSKRYFADWSTVRLPAPNVISRQGQVFYGQLPRYR